MDSKPYKKLLLQEAQEPLSQITSVDIPHPIYLVPILNIILISPGFKVVLAFRFSKQNYEHISSIPYVPHSRAISYALIWSPG